MMQKSRIARKGTPRRRGFTLLELILVVAIIGILARIALPNFIGGKDQAYLNAMQSDLRNLMAEQEQFFQENDVYASGTIQDGNDGGTGQATGGGVTLDFTTSDDVSIVISDVTLRGYTAVASHTKFGGATATPPIQCEYVVARGSSAKITCDDLPTS